MTFYLKYRPQTIDELDLEGVRESLKNILNSGNIPHAFLFSGPKGTGKTSAARILAKIINCSGRKGGDIEPCNKCDSCLSIMRGNNIDVIEMDAASNRGIDDIRSLKEGIYLAPNMAKKKVYIIDEAHMLTLEAANAFLKTLEEPPEHVVFILATTNPEKLPQTVISRLTRIDFMKATAKDIARQLARVAKGEKIEIDEKAIEKVARLADGSFRDAVKILENLSFKTKKIKLDDVASEKDVKDFFELLNKKDTKEVLLFIEEMVKRGRPVKNFMDEATYLMHTSILAKSGIGEDGLKDYKITELIELISLFDEAKNVNSNISQLPLELSIIKYCSKLTPPDKDTPVKKEPTSKEEEKDTKAIPSDEKKKETKKEEKKEVKKNMKELDSEVWQKILTSAHEKNISIEALLRSAKPLGFDGTTLELGVYYQFHKDKLSDGKTRTILEDICKSAMQKDFIAFTFELIEKPPKTLKKEETVNVKSEVLNPKVDTDIIDAAKEIFG